MNMKYIYMNIENMFGIHNLCKLVTYLVVKDLDTDHNKHYYRENNLMNI